MIRAVLLRLDKGLALACKWIVVGCFIGLFVLLSLGIVQRSLPFLALPGYDELVELLFAWMTFVGALALWREGVLYRVNTVDHLLSRRARTVLSSLIHLGMLSIAVLLAVKGWDFMQMSGETTPFLQIDKSYWYAALPVCGALMAVYSAIAFWRALHGETGLDGDQVTMS